MADNKMMLAVFADAKDADAAVNALANMGIHARDISVMMREMVNEVPTGQNETKEAEAGVVTGAAEGGVIGGIAGLIIGIAAIVIPGIGALIVGGPLAAALGFTEVAVATASGALTGALAGGVVGALTHVGLPAEQAAQYEAHLQKGGIVIAVPVTDQNADMVAEVFKNNHALDVNTVTMQS